MSSQYIIDPKEKLEIQSHGYFVTAIIGKGEYGNVYQAFDELGKEYAIKAVSLRKAHRKAPKLQMFLNELAISKRLSALYYDSTARQQARKLSSLSRCASKKKKATRSGSTSPRSSMSQKQFLRELTTFMINNGAVSAVSPPPPPVSTGCGGGNDVSSVLSSFSLCDNSNKNIDYNSYENNNNNIKRRSIEDQLITDLMLRKKLSSDEESIVKEMEKEDDDEKQKKKKKKDKDRPDYKGVVVIYDVFVKNQSYFLVMERLNGDTLDKYIKKRTSPLPVHQIREYMYQALTGLNFLWQHGIVHRDIKPENIMFSKNDCKELKLIDIGLGRFIPFAPVPSTATTTTATATDTSAPTITTTTATTTSLSSPPVNSLHISSRLFSEPNGDNYKAVEASLLQFEQEMERARASEAGGLTEADLMRSPVGTPLYASPEIEAGRGYTRNCDLWSLGMSFYFMASGGRELVRKRVASFRREKRLVWEEASKENYVFQGITSPDINRILCYMLCKTPLSPEEILRDPWFDNCREDALVTPLSSPFTSASPSPSPSSSPSLSGSHDYGYNAKSA